MAKSKTVKEKQLEIIVSRLKQDCDFHNKYRRSKIDLNDLLQEVKKQFEL